MSILQKLTEGVQSRDLRAEGAALLNKWEATGLLEGLADGQVKQGMAVLLENQAKELLREASSMAAGDVEGFAAVAFPIVRRVFGGLIANDLISVQPMSLPSGLIFFLDFTHSDGRLGREADTSLYGGGVVAKGIIDGVSDIAETGFYGLSSGYAAATGSVAAAGAIGTVDSPSEAVAGDRSKIDYDPDLDGKFVIRMVGEAADHNQTHLALLDPGAPRAVVPDQASSAVSPLANDASFASGDASVMVVDDGSALTGGATDEAKIGAPRVGDLLVGIKSDGGATIGGTTFATNAIALFRLRPIKRLTQFTTSNNAEGLKAVTAISRLAFEVVNMAVQDGTGDLAIANKDNWLAAVNNANAAAGTVDQAIATALAAALAGGAQFGVRGPVRDDINAVGLGALQAGAMPLEEAAAASGVPANGASGDSKDLIPEIDIKVDSVAVTAQTKKLKAKWTPELGQDLNAYHNLDAEVELTGILSEQIALEIDRELLMELVEGATAGTRYWSRAPGLFVNSSGAEVGASSAAPDFTGTVSEWYETLIETINDVSAQIHRKTLRGGANFVVCSPEVANILEFTSGFRASVTADQDRGTIGAVRAGSLSKKFDVYVDPYFLRNVLLVGRKGSSFLESGYVYAPYVPLQVTPTIFGTEDFVPRKGVMTRYAKKMVRPDMYGLVIVRGLLGESGATA